MVSYKDIYLGVNGHNISSEDEEMFGLDEEGAVHEEEEKFEKADSDFLGDPLCPVVRLTSEEKKYICSPWRRSILVKLLGKRMGLKYFHARLMKLWRPHAPMEIIDLDNEEPSLLGAGDMAIRRMHVPFSVVPIIGSKLVQYLLLPIQVNEKQRQRWRTLRLALGCGSETEESQPRYW
ncbi:hypothetical protein SESBI_03787 [Sesbania bispinosa]|nr:hypothetical protein SESBI_03787 [Sesbania bispinosa]